MGSGRGKTRRSLTSTKSPQSSAHFNAWMWEKFTDTADVANINLHRYYLGHVPKDPTTDDYEKVLSGLLADAVRGWCDHSSRGL